MARTFKYPLSIFVFEKTADYLCLRLKELGYTIFDIEDIDDNPVLVTNYGGINGKVKNTNYDARANDGRKVIPQGRVELFLALAGMSGENNVLYPGEVVVDKENSTDLYRVDVIEKHRILVTSLINEDDETEIPIADYRKASFDQIWNFHHTVKIFKPVIEETIKTTEESVGFTIPRSEFIKQPKGKYSNYAKFIEDLVISFQGRLWFGIPQKDAERIWKKYQEEESEFKQAINGLVLPETSSLDIDYSAQLVSTEPVTKIEKLGMAQKHVQILKIPKKQKATFLLAFFLGLDWMEDKIDPRFFDGDPDGPEQ